LASRRTASCTKREASPTNRLDGGDVGRRTPELREHRRHHGGVALEQRAEALRPQEIAHADADARGLALVGRADPAPGGADVARALLAQAIDLLVVGQRDVRSLGDHQVAIAAHEALLAEGGDLLDQRGGIDHHPLAEHAGDPRAQDPRRDQARDVLLAVDHQRVAGVRAPRPAADHLGVLREQVDDLPLPLVPPLGSDHYDDGHGILDFLIWISLGRSR
jgi:hypothetical protein